MFKKLLNKIGIGSASVNLVLDHAEPRVGEEITGRVMIHGGNSDTRIDAIHVTLKFEAKIGDHEVDRELDKVIVGTGIISREEEHIELPFRYVIPEVPASSVNVKYSLMTSLDIPGAMDKYDFDEIRIYPRAEIGAVMDALGSLGFHVSPHEAGKFDGRFQFYEYKAVGGHFAEHIEELEVVFLPEPEGIRLHVELDRRGHGVMGRLADRLDMNEQFFSLLIPYHVLNDPRATADMLVEALEAELRNPYPNRHNPLKRKHQASHNQHGGTYNQSNYNNNYDNHQEHHEHHHHHDHDHHEGGGFGEAMAGAAVGAFAGYAVGEFLFDDDNRRDDGEYFEDNNDYDNSYDNSYDNDNDSDSGYED